MGRATPQEWALGITWALAGFLLVLGLYMLSLPAIMLFRTWPYYLLPPPEIVVAIGLLVLLFRHITAQALLWIAAKLHRIFSSLLLVIALGADGLLHVFSVPHIEGWWLSLIGSSALLTLLNVWIQKIKARRNP